MIPVVVTVVVRRDRRVAATVVVRLDRLAAATTVAMRDANLHADVRLPLAVVARRVTAACSASCSTTSVLVAVRRLVNRLADVKHLHVVVTRVATRAVTRVVTQVATRVVTLAVAVIRAANRLAVAKLPLAVARRVTAVACWGICSRRSGPAVVLRLVSRSVVAKPRPVVATVDVTADATAAATVDVLPLLPAVVPRS